MSCLLVLNAGSSSLKYAVYREAERLHGGKRERLTADGQQQAIQSVLAEIRQVLGSESLLAVGHRVVHGGDQFHQPVLITDAVLQELDRLTPLAQLHQPHNIAGIRAMMAALPGIPQVACFDTAFHATMPLVERMFGIPRHFYESGIRRYGFHGLAYESVVEHLRSHDPASALGRLIACHLGNGASLCAIRDGHSVATTMGFTPLDGLLMGTRCGSLDPGVVLYLERHIGMQTAEVDQLLEHESGLLGVSGGLSSDLRDLLASESPIAREAVDLFCHRIIREIGSLAAVLGGVDAITFSGGIGENSAIIRERILTRLDWLGMTWDSTANQAGADRISTASSRVCVVRVPVQEENIIARHTARILGLPWEA
ncbi:MAG: acetate/propionate family kinase [Bacteroidales bacterium]|nr:acetate/propionate family kinase [Bacteroidales bacterium]